MEQQLSILASLKKWREKNSGGGSPSMFEEAGLDGLISPYAAAIEKRKQRFQKTEKEMASLSEEN